MMRVGWGSRIWAIVAILILVCVSVLEAQTKVGDFTVKRDTDPITDDDRSWMASHGEDTDVGLGLKCLEDGLNVLLMHKYLIGDSDDEIRVVYRFDNDTPVPEHYWMLATGKTLSFSPMGRIPWFIERAKTANRIAIRVVDPGDGEVLTDIVSLDGFSEALANLPCSR